jgi:hypothetical protein
MSNCNFTPSLYFRITENGEVEIKTPFHVTGCTREDHDASLPNEKDRSDEGYQGPHEPL